MSSHQLQHAPGLLYAPGVAPFTEAKRQQGNKNIILNNGESLAMNIRGAKSPDIATITLNKNTEAVGRNTQVEPGTTLQIIDVRKLPKNEHGGSLFFGSKVADDVDLLVFDPAQLDLEKGVGYKGIRQGEIVHFGRGKLNDRFPKSAPTTSREHVAVSLLDDGTLVIVDDNSTNGTRVTTTEGMMSQKFNSLDEEENRSTFDDNERRSGKIALLPQEYESRTRELPNGVAIINKEKIDRFIRLVERDTENNAGVSEMMQIDKFRPTNGLKIDDRVFLISDVFKYEGRECAVMYQVGRSSSESSGQILPVFLYKSNSDGGWRASDGFDDEYGRGGRFSKEIGSPEISVGGEFGQYVQATKPVEAITSMLEHMEKSSHDHGRISPDEEDVLTRILGSTYRGEHDFFGYDPKKALTFTKVNGFGLDTYISGGYSMCYGVEGPMRRLEMIQLPEGFEPNFDNVDRQYVTNHTVLGACGVDVFVSELNGRKCEWHMAHDLAGRGFTWVDRIVYVDSKVNGYGGNEEVILAGILSAKPIDYRSGAHMLGDQIVGTPLYDTSWDNDRGIPEGARRQYYSAKNILNRIPSVRRYRQSFEKRSRERNLHLA